MSTEITLNEIRKAKPQKYRGETVHVWLKLRSRVIGEGSNAITTLQDALYNVQKKGVQYAYDKGAEQKLRDDLLDDQEFETENYDMGIQRPKFALVCPYKNDLSLVI